MTNSASAQTSDAPADQPADQTVAQLAAQPSVESVVTVDPAEPTAKSVAAGVGWVTLGAMVANILGYLLHLVGTNFLGPERYGQFAALLAVQVVLSVPAIALQAVVARERVRGASRAILQKLIWHTVWVTVGLTALLGVGLVFWFAEWSPVEAVAALLSVPLVVGVFGQLGVIQGDRRFAVLAGLVAIVGAAKVVPASVMLAFRSVPGAFVMAAVGLAVAWALCWVVVQRLEPRWELQHEVRGDLQQEPQHSSSQLAPVRASARASGRDVAVASQVQLFIMLFTQLDVILAPQVLDASQAGVYAAGAVVTKIALWLPAAVVTVFYPLVVRKNQRGDERGELASFGVAALVLLLVGALVAGAVAAVAQWAPQLVPLVLGKAYAPVVPFVVAFALLGSLMSVMQWLTMSAVAVQGEWHVLWGWPFVVLELVLALTVVHSLTGLLSVALGCVGATVLVLMLERTVPALWRLFSPRG